MELSLFFITFGTKYIPNDLLNLEHIRAMLTIRSAWRKATSPIGNAQQRRIECDDNRPPKYGGMHTYLM